jgi:T-complex protein 1 subunit eta
VNAEIRLNNPSQYQKLVDAEWKIIYEKLEIIVKSGAQIVLSELPIGDLATQYFADCNIFCAGRVPKDDIMRIAAATGAKLQTSINELNSSSLGTCSNFEEKQIGNQRYDFFLNCPATQTVTFIIRGLAEQYIQETERSLHDGIMIVKRCIQYQSIVPGGGATEMELSRKLRQHARRIRDKSQVIINAFAKAFEVIPRQLAINSGFDSTDLINELRYKHSKGDKYQGIDIDNERTFDTFENFVWEPTLSKYSSISAACETACTILSIDETIHNPHLEDPSKLELQNNNLSS